MTYIPYKKLLRRALSIGAVLLVSLSPSLSYSEEAVQKKDTPKKPVTVTSDRMEANNKESIVKFIGNVVAVEDFTICSDVLEIRYGADKDVKEITAIGNVTILQENKTSTSGRAVYDRPERKVVLTEDPVVTQCADTIKGDRITVFLDDENAIVESGKSGRVKAVITPEKKCEEGVKAPVNEPGEETRCKRPR